MKRVLPGAFLLASCAGILYPNWSSLIKEHGYEKRKFKATTLTRVEIPGGILRSNLLDTSLASCEYGEILDSIRPGNDDYFVVFKNYLAHGGENQPSDELEIAFLYLDRGKIVPGKSIYVHDWNEIPFRCAFLSEAMVAGNRVLLKGHGREAELIEKEFEYIASEKMDIDSLRSERKKIRTLASEALK